MPALVVGRVEVEETEEEDGERVVLFGGGRGGEISRLECEIVSDWSRCIMVYVVIRCVSIR